MKLALFFAVLLVARPTSAKGWPQPAAGESPNGEIEILFTFDDGPNPKTTPEVLDILKAHHIHAVFFMVGEMAGNENKKVPAIVQRVLDEGHIIATHTMTHQDLCKLKDRERAAGEIDKGKATVDRVAQIDTGWFRVPYGVRCQQVEELLAERHLEHFHWDLDPQEWKHGNLDRTVKYVTKEFAHAAGREVLLMHDIKPVTVKALPEILQWLDEENARREKSRRHKIRILQAPALAIERLPPGLVDWVADATAGLRGLPHAMASALP
jgi:peptidoglycan/xylan/chitin deacetylase (PgdA/CDA1 family)